MSKNRGTYTNILRSQAVKIFGPEFKKDWFARGYERESVELLQTLSGAHITPKGKKYRLLAPILFPRGEKVMRKIFLNPALIEVSILFSHIPIA